MSRVWGHSKSRNGSLLVLISIAEKADDYGTASDLTVSQIAKSSRLSIRHAQRAMSELKKSGELEVTYGNGESNIYQIRVGGL